MNRFTEIKIMMWPLGNLMAKKTYIKMFYSVLIFTIIMNIFNLLPSLSTPCIKKNRIEKNTLIIINTFLMMFMFSGGTSLRPSEYGAHWLLGETSSCPLSKILLCCEGV